jgi:cytochrome c oxidase subunit 3
LDTPATHLVDHFENLEKQAHAARLGMWVFLGSEALLFSGLFALYAGYRVAYPADFAMASGFTDLPLGTLMTVTLVTSSYFVALAVGMGRSEFRRGSFRSLLAALALGIAFLALKAIEYTLHIRDGIVPGHLRAGAPLSGRGADLFFTLYYFMTGLHALHVIVGLGIIGWLAWRTRRLAFDAEYHTPLELGGMYWHFVDIIWLFLWPIFYLLR